MRASIDRAGRVVVPKALRDLLRLGAGAEVEVTVLDGRIEITPVPAEIRFSETTEGPVAESVRDLPALTDEDVRSAIEAVRR